MYCSKCGKEVRDGAAFCPHCGAPLAQAEPADYEDEYEEYEEPAAAAKKGLSTPVIIAIIAAAALVLLAGIMAFTSLTHSKQEAQIAQMEAQVAQAEAEAEKAKQEAIKAQEEQKKAQEQQIKDQQAQEQAQAQAEAQASQPQTVNNYYYYGTGYASGTYYSSVTSSGYLWPTDSKYISRSDLSNYDQDTVAAIRNEIYARHGYAFQTARWKNYFGSKSWYVRDSSCTQSVAMSRMNKIEKANVATIVQYEKDMGWN